MRWSGPLSGSSFGHLVCTLYDSQVYLKSVDMADADTKSVFALVMELHVPSQRERERLQTTTAPLSSVIIMTGPYSDGCR